MKNNSILADYE